MDVRSDTAYLDRQGGKFTLHTYSDGDAVYLDHGQGSNLTRIIAWARRRHYRVVRIDQRCRACRQANNKVCPV